MKYNIFLLTTLLIFGYTFSAPSQQSLVVSSTESSNENEKKGSSDSLSLNPVIYEMDIATNISNRFAKTLVASKVKNTQASAKEATFTVVLPENAFISEFIMEIGGKSYKAYVKEKEEAKNIYNAAVASGQSAGHVSVSARDSNRFTVSVNIEPESKAVFLLTYEELLQRKYEQYELVINIHPGQIVKNLNVKVQVNESRPLKFVKTPSLRTGNEISKNEDKLDPLSDIKIINSTTAVVEFNPDAEKQKQFAHDLNTKESEGLSGQFVVQYDVERDPHGGEVLLQDGYFVHFFAPSDLEPLPKHVVFVLDTSGSMNGRRIEQLKDAMKSIFNEIKRDDFVNIIEFNENVKVWDITEGSSALISYGYEENYEEPFSKLNKLYLPSPIIAANETIEKAKNVVDEISTGGLTNMIGGLETALYLVKVGQNNQADKKHQPIIIFLTDGEPNVGISSTEEIVRIVTRLNSNGNNVPIYSLSFGYGANKEFLRKLSLKNQGFSRHIYEASDASLQLQEFYKQISSPLLSNIKFKYNSEVKDVTKSSFPILFRGSELVVTGKYEDSDSPFEVATNCWAAPGPKKLTPRIERPVSSLERLWAYLTVKQTLEERDLADNKSELTKKALDLALKYSFVTDITSLVVVKPNDTRAVDTEEAATVQNEYFPSLSPRPQFSTGYGFASSSRPSPFQGGYFPSLSPRPQFSNRGYGFASSSRISSFYPRSRTGPFILPQQQFRGYIGMPGLPGPIGLAGPSAPIPYNAPLGQSVTLKPHVSGYSGVAIRPEPVLYNARPGQSSILRPHNGQSTPLRARAFTLPTVQHHPTTSIPKLEDTLTWLASVLNPNRTITISQGVYELGENSTITVHTKCPKTPVNGTDTGTCTLLKDCPRVYSYLTDFQVYQQYFCPINNKFAGVCCPTKIFEP